MPPKKKLRAGEKQPTLPRFKFLDKNNNCVEANRPLSPQPTEPSTGSNLNEKSCENSSSDPEKPSDSSTVPETPSTAPVSTEPDPSTSTILLEEKNKLPTEKIINNWKKLYPWLSVVGQKMYCQECVGRGKSNTMTTGCTNFKTSTLSRHEATSDHIEALDKAGLRNDFSKAIETVFSDEDKAVMKAISTVIWLANENLPLSKFESLRGLLCDLDVPGLSLLKCSDRVNYDSYYSAGEFMDSISDYLDEQINVKLENSPCISVLADESTDIANKKRITINAITIDPTNSKRETIFLRNLEYEDGTGIGLATVITDELKARKVSFDKVIGFGSDGASVMTGKDRGVKGILMRKQPFLIHIHCMAHRLALCTSQAAENINCIKEYQRWLTNLFYYFKASGSREQEVNKVQEILNHKVLKYKEIHAVRWLSCYQAVEAVYRTLDPLLSYFHQRIASKDPKAKGLLKTMATTEFIYITYLLMDVLPLVSKLCLRFQEQDLDLGQAKVAINTCISELESLKNGTQVFKTHTEQFDKDVTEKDGKFEFCGHVLHNKNSNLISIKSRFINQLLSNISARFPQKGLVDAFYALGMRTINFEPVDQYGNDEIEILLEHFGEEKTFGDVAVPALLSKDLIRREWMQAKEIVTSLKYPVDRFQELWNLLTIHHCEEIPHMIQLAQYAIVLPLHTADCERVFSQQNKIITKQRAKLSANKLDQLLKVRLSKEEIPTDIVLSIWRRKKNRTLYYKKK